MRNLEVFHIETTEKGTFAHISFIGANGYDNIKIPVNLRPIQVSSRGNILVDQSIKNEVNLTM